MPVLRAFAITTFLLSAMVLADAPGPRPAAPADELDAFLAEHPAARVSIRRDRIRRIAGPRLATGGSPDETMQRFRADRSGVLGLEPRQLEPIGPPRSLGFDPARGTFRFAAQRYRHVVDGVPVFRSEIVLLVRNEPAHPLVLVSSDVRDAGGVRPPAAGPPPADPRRVAEAAQRAVGRGAVIVESSPVIWAGLEDDEAPTPRLAHRTTVIGPEGDPWLLVTDAADAGLLHLEPMICRIDFSGRVDGLVTEGAAAAPCEDEVLQGVPLARIEHDGGEVFADALGDFTLDAASDAPLDVTASLSGQYFRIFNEAGPPLTASAVATVDEPAQLLLNTANDELERAQLNAFVGLNRVRRFVFDHNPLYPGLQFQMPVFVNREDSHCPGNAWYDFLASTLNFCRAGEEHPNTAWSSVLYHEYGHHLVQMSGSGQGAYGEGIGDAISILMLDRPELALGLSGDCEVALRTADNDCEFHPVGCSTCGVSVHSCAQLLSGAVWSLRNELLAVEPDTYRQTLAALVLDSILIHTGASIDDQLALDFLTVDDDNDNIFDGTPHYHQIADAFAAHDLHVPFVPLISLTFPDGLPDLLPAHQPVVRTMEVQELTGVALPRSGAMHISPTGLPGSFYEVPMTPLDEHRYEVVLPGVECWSVVYYYFSAEAALGVAQSLHTYPVDAPRHTLVAVTADAVVEGGFADDFELDLGWTVTNDELLEDGAWEREIPTGSGGRGDPPSDADGSGHCYLTEDDPEDINSDVDHGTTILTSPALDAREDADASFVSYYRWYSNTRGGNPLQDIFVVEVSDDDGATWTTLEVVGPSGPDVSGGWIFRRFRIAEVVEPTETFRIRFIASDTDPQSVVEAGIDRVEVRRYTCRADGAPCLADVDGDGTVGADDLLAVLLAWSADGGPADVDGNGVVDLGDLLLVVIDWGPCA